MSHINSDTLQGYKGTHSFIHHLLKRYYEEQTVTDEELVEALETIKRGCAESIEAWKAYLGHD
jgi:hypothetical protein